MKKKEGKQINVNQIVIGAFGGVENCIGIVENVSTPESGGIFTKYVGCNYLFKGYPDYRILDYIYASKRVLAGFFQLMKNKPIRFLLGIDYIFYLLMPKASKKKVLFGVMDYVLSITHWIEYKYVFALQTNLYCKSVREIYRASEIILNDFDEDYKKRLRKFRDIACMILEMDYAYRARFQDILPLLDKEALKKNPKKELKRLTDIFIEREAVDGYNVLTDKWIGLQKILLTGLRFKKIRNVIMKFLLEIDLKEIERDESDWYFALNRNDYLYGGKTYEERLKIKEEMDKKANNNIPKVVIKQKDENNQKNN